MFFELNSENKIGYKTLSKADMGTGISHQTHIGLSEKVLTFLPNRDVQVENSIFIYRDQFEFLDANFDRILLPNGAYRSPKIRIGERGAVSVVSTIRDIVPVSENTRWYLIWFGLKDQRIVFFLVQEATKEYEEMTRLGLDLNEKHIGVLENSTPVFWKIVESLEKKINRNALPMLRELEVRSQTDVIDFDQKIKTYDILKAKELFAEIGKRGEALVYEYLSRQYSKNEIKQFNWHNQEQESSLPYDFTIQLNDDNLVTLDVKTTNYDFTQDMIFSSQEVKHIAYTPTRYYVYRVYKVGEEDFRMRIAQGSKEFSKTLLSYTDNYEKTIAKVETKLKTIKFAIPPTNRFFNFNNEIVLG